jgi:sulfite oxidase
LKEEFKEFNVISTI